MFNKEEVKKLIVVDKYYLLCNSNDLIRKEEIEDYIKEEQIAEGDLCKVYYQTPFKLFKKAKPIIKRVEKIIDESNRVQYNYSSKELIVTKRQFDLDKNSSDWFRGSINLEKAKLHLKDIHIDKGDFVEVNYKELIIDGEVVKREIQSINKLEGISYNIKTQKTKVKKTYSLSINETGIEFENGHTYTQGRFLNIDPCPIEEQQNEIYRKIFMYENDLCNETYLEIFKNGINTGKTITIQVEKIRDDIIMSKLDKSPISSYEDVEKLLEDSPMPKFPWIKDKDICAQDLLDI